MMSIFEITMRRRGASLFLTIPLLAIWLAFVGSNSQAQRTQPSSERRLPILFVCGDSTAAPSRSATQGWGEMIAEFFDPARITIENRALGGRSSRTFITEKRWEAVYSKLHKGDFVILQFGHNDTKAQISANRYTMPGLGDEVEEGTGIHTFGYYMKQMIDQTLEKGATPIILSPVPRSKWANGKIVRGEDNHGPWAQELAKIKGVPFVDVNGMIADIYDPIGQPRVKATLFTPQDHTHQSNGRATECRVCRKRYFAVERCRAEALSPRHSSGSHRAIDS